MSIYPTVKLVVFLTFLRAVKSVNQREVQKCSNLCFCEKIEPEKLAAKCNVTGFQNSSTRYLFGPSFAQIHSLDLSHTNLQHLGTRMFQNLTRLTKLNLQFNDMRSWYGNIARDLPNLVYLNVTGNQRWLPSYEVLTLPKLKIINGVWWRKECGVCSLVKKETKRDVNQENTCNDKSLILNATKNCNNESKEAMCRNGNCEDDNQGNSTFDTQNNKDKRNKRDVDDNENDDDENNDEPDNDFPYSNSINYGHMYKFYKLYFIAKCKHRDLCKYYEVDILYDNARFKVFMGMKYTLYLLGTVSIFINLVVIVTVIVRDKLRASPSFILIAVLAVSDLLTGLYSTLQANFTSFVTFHQGEILSHSTIHINTIKCYISGYIFTTAQVTSPMTSLFLTVERYLVIVYGLNPEKRLTRKAALLCSSFVWIVTMVIAAVPFTLESVRYHPMSHCTLPNVFETKASFGVRIGLYLATSILVVPYILGIILYHRIYANVKRSGQEIGNRTDLKVAKKISQIVFSNLIFFVIPTVLLYLHSNFYNFVPGVFTETLVAHRIYLFVFTCLPLLCFNVNACLNPFLFALRNDTFKQQLKCLLAGIFVKCRKIRNPPIVTNQSTPRLNNHGLINMIRFNDNNTDINGAYYNECTVKMEEKQTTSL